MNQIFEAPFPPADFAAPRELTAEEQQNPEAVALHRAHEENRVLREKHPEWMAVFDDSFLDTLATQREMHELMATAPNLFALGVVYGKLTLRLELAAHTGIPMPE